MKKKKGRRDRIRNVNILNELAVDKDIVDILRTRRLSYFGHVARMDCHRYPHILLHEYDHGARARGRPREKWIDNIKENCSLLQLDVTMTIKGDGRGRIVLLAILGRKFPSPYLGPKSNFRGKKK